MKEVECIKWIKKIRRNVYKIQRFMLRKYIKKAKYVYGLNREKRDLPEIIISMTTFPKRISKIDLCIKSILRQSLKPDKIIIWLGSDTTYELAKEYLDKYKQYGVEYVIDSKNNYYSHKKYIYAFKQYRDSIVVTLDDDLIYSKSVLKSLIKKYKKYPNSIVARRVHEITWNKDEINPYRKWNWECFTIRKPTNRLCATTGAGTLFPPNIYNDKDLDFNIIKEYALTADDIWLKMMAVKNKIEVVWAGNFLQMPLEIKSESSNALSSINVINNQNDICISKIIKEYKLIKENFV